MPYLHLGALFTHLPRPRTLFPSHLIFFPKRSAQQRSVGRVRSFVKFERLQHSNKSTALYQIIPSPPPESKLLLVHSSQADQRSRRSRITVCVSRQLLTASGKHSVFLLSLAKIVKKQMQQLGVLFCKWGQQWRAEKGATLSIHGASFSGVGIK